MKIKTLGKALPGAKGLIIAAASLVGLAGAGMALAFDFEPLGEGILPSGKYVQDYRFTLYPGESVPWHYHPGPVNVVIVSGTITEDEGCGARLNQYSGGSAFTEAPGAIHRVFNNGTGPLVIIVNAVVGPAYAGYASTVYVDGPKCDEDGHHRRDDDDHGRHGDDDHHGRGH